MGNIVYVVGSVNEDLRLRMERLPEPGETVSADSVETGLGGKGANQAVAAARSGVPVRFIGAVGDDDPGDRLRRALSDDGIAADRLRSVPHVASGRAFVLVDDDGRNSIVVEAGANGALDADEVRAGLDDARPGDVVLCQLETGLDAARAAVRTARTRGAYTVVNIAPFHAGVLSLLADVDLVVANEHECADLRSALAAAGGGTVADLGDRMLVTLGASGSVLGEETVRVAGDAVTVVDTTAAGDTYVGYLAAGLAEGRPIAEAMRQAGRAAAITVGRAGAARSIPHAHEI
ncbi:ribokinase [Microbacterium sp. 179-I 3D3 NHS]|uniref:ribokinase n=1 Tax=Microbacterium sp. 179-I 3D3 NHS TaxID=3142382 RepID=UPI0039A059F1